jgi:hypothetical protein
MRMPGRYKMCPFGSAEQVRESRRPPKILTMQFRELKHFDGCVCTDTDSPSFQAHLLTTGLPL